MRQNASIFHGSRYLLLKRFICRPIMLCRPDVFCHWNAISVFRQCQEEVTKETSTGQLVRQQWPRRVARPVSQKCRSELPSRSCRSTGCCGPWSSPPRPRPAPRHASRTSPSHRPAEGTRRLHNVNAHLLSGEAAGRYGWRLLMELGMILNDCFVGAERCFRCCHPI